MITEPVIYVTTEGLAKMRQELTHLKEVRLPETNDRLERAVSHGDLAENSDYAAAKREQSFLIGRMTDLEDALRRAEVIENDLPKDEVCIGAMVTVAEEGWDESETYRIVAVHEADPLAGLISQDSPIGQALMGARIGVTVEAATPGGAMRLTVLSIQ